MKKTQQQLIAVCLMLASCFNAFSQTCSLVGWASQNGGVTGGGSATPTVVSNYTDFKNAITSATVKVVHISGTITFPAAGRINFQDQSAKTVYGMPGSKLVSSDLTASGSGIIYIKRCTNIIFRNVKFEGPGAFDTDGNDNMTIDNCSNVWIDHCDFQDGVDGNLDVKNLADYISITWCRFIYLKPPVSGGSGGADDHRFSNLFGSSDGATGDRGKLRITMQNCWWAQGCRERMPRVRFGKVHIVNNYFSCTGNNHCIRAGFEADLRVESNYFENVNNPIDLFENDFTAVSSINNSFVGTTGNTAGSGTAFTPPYSLTVTPAANVKSQVIAGAGATLSSPACGGGTTTFTLTTTASPTAGGTVSGGGSYSSGSTATVTATAASGYTFTGWSGAASGTTNPITVTMDANKSITANFTATATTFTLTTTASPTAGGTVSGAGSYASGATATVTATAASGYTFTGWSGAASGTTNPLSVTMNANKSVTANFTATATTFTLTTTASPTAGGTVSGAGSYASGATATVTATAASGYTFTGWSGAASGTTNPLAVTMNANKAITANFQVNGGGSSTVRIEDNATATTGLCSFDGTISSNSAASNTKVINLSNSTAKGITWKVNAGAAGSYILTWRYVNSSSNNTYTMKLIVNGATINSAQPFPQTSSSTTFANSTATVSLLTGGNTIRLESVASNATADIDWIEITGNAPAAGNCNAARTSSAPETTLAMEQIASAAKMGVYPNPSNGIANVGFYLPEADNISITVINAQGKTLHSQSTQLQAGYHVKSLNIRGRQAGFYTVIVSGKKKPKETFKLVIE